MISAASDFNLSENFILLKLLAASALFVPYVNAGINGTLKLRRDVGALTIRVGYVMTLKTVSIISFF